MIINAEAILLNARREGLTSHEINCQTWLMMSEWLMMGMIVCHCVMRSQQGDDIIYGNGGFSLSIRRTLMTPQPLLMMSVDPPAFFAPLGLLKIEVPPYHWQCSCENVVTRSAVEKLKLPCEIPDSTPFMVRNGEWIKSKFQVLGPFYIRGFMIRFGVLSIKCMPSSIG